MFKIDVNDYLEKSAMRKARFGGYEPDDVRRAMRELCAAYEQALADAEKQQQESRAESDALRRRCQTLLGQAQSLTAQNATLAAKADKLNGEQIDWETRYNKVQERNHSLSDQVAVLRLKNNDLVRENSELAEKAADAAAALRIKGRAHDDARKQLEEDRNSIIAGAHYDGDVIRREAKAEADSVLQHADAKAKAIEKLAREQAAQEASKLVQAATDEAREIQNAHRLRLEDLKRCVTEMEEKRTAALDIMAKLVGELQEVQDFARRNNVPLPEQTEIPEVAALPEFTLPEDKIDSEAEKLYEQEHPAPTPAAETPDEPEPPAEKDPAPLPAADAEPPEQQPVVKPVVRPVIRPVAASADRDAAPKKEKVEIPGAIFSYPIVHPEEETKLGDETPPAAAPLAPVMPDLLDEDGDELGRDSDIYLIPDKKNKPDPRRRKAIIAMRSLRKKLTALT